MTLTIELSDDQAAALRAKAAAEGLSLEVWIQKLAEEKTTPLAEKSLLQFFRESPLVGLELTFERDKDPGREIIL